MHVLFQIYIIICLTFQLEVWLGLTWVRTRYHQMLWMTMLRVLRSLEQWLITWWLTYLVLIPQVLGRCRDVRCSTISYRRYVWVLKISNQYFYGGCSCMLTKFLSSYMYLRLTWARLAWSGRYTNGYVIGIIMQKALLI